MGKRYKRWSRTFLGCLGVVLCFCGVPLWASLDMYVYNVGQANCILVTINSTAIFFDTGMQKRREFEESLIRSHILKVIASKSTQNIWFILSHTDDDHINVLGNILKICNDNDKRVNGVIVGTTLPRTKEIVDQEKAIKQELVKMEVNPKLINSGLACLRFAAQRKVVEQRNFAINVDEVSNAVLRSLQQQFEHMAGFDLGQLSSIFELVPIVSMQVELWSGGLEEKLGVDPNLITPIVNGVSAPFSIPRGDASIDFLMPQERYTVSGANDASLVTRLYYGRRSILFTGDAPGKLFDAVAHNFNFDQPESLPDILICPHHGSMSEGSYRWKGELNHPGMISIISSNPACGKDHLPERSFMDYPLLSLCFQPHFIAYHSRLRGICCRLTSAPVFVTGCSGILPPFSEDVSPILHNTGIGYHICINSGRAIGVAMINFKIDEDEVLFYDEQINENGFAPDGGEIQIVLPQIQTEEEEEDREE